MTTPITEAVLSDPDNQPTLLDTIHACLARIRESEAHLGIRDTEHLDNVTRITALEAAVEALQAAVDSLTTRVSTLEANYATDHASIVSMTAHLVLINAVLHLW